MKFMQIRHFLVGLALAAAAPFAAAVFQSGMTGEQAEEEARLQRNSKVTLAQIAQNALAAKLNDGIVTAALITAGFDSAAVVEAMLRANAPLQSVVNGAFAAGAGDDDVRNGALAAKVARTNVDAAIKLASSYRSTTVLWFSNMGGGGGCSKFSASGC